MQAIYNKFSQGILVSGCAVMTFATLGFMINDSFEIQKKQMKNMYESQIKVLNEENNLKNSNSELVKSIT